jgi:hypothetical protein
LQGIGSHDDCSCEECRGAANARQMNEERMNVGTIER